MSLIRKIINKIEQDKAKLVQEDKIDETVVNELSQTTLKHYINKAVDDVSYHSFSAGDSTGQHVKKINGKTTFTGSPEDKEEQLNHDKKSFKRQKGIIKAANKLGKDDVNESTFPTTFHNNYKDWEKHVNQLGGTISHDIDGEADRKQSFAHLPGRGKPIGGFNHKPRKGAPIGAVYGKRPVSEDINYQDTHSIYQRMKDAHVEMDHHESDLYVPINGVTQIIVKQALADGDLNRHPQTFKSNVDGKWWYDFEFAYEPFWHKGHAMKSVIEGLRLVGKHSKDNKTAKVYKDHDWQEHRVKFYTDGKHHTEADYHTDDPEDAHATAKHWAGITEETINELSQKTLKSYVEKAKTDLKSKEATLDRTPMDADVSNIVKKIDDRTNKMVDAKRKLPRGNPYDVVAESDTVADIDQDIVGDDGEEDITAPMDPDIVSEAEQLVERHLTSSEEDRKEDYVHAMKKNLSHFNKKYGKRGKSVMYAVATKMAKSESIDSDSLKAQLIVELSKKTLGNYIEKAVDDVDGKSYAIGSSDVGIQGAKSITKMEKSIEKRKDGVKTAVKKLTKESKESEHGANLELVKTKESGKKGSLDDYFDHNDKTTKKQDKKITKE